MSSMAGTNRLKSPADFSGALFERMHGLAPGIDSLLPYEFRYALENLLPEAGWEAAELESRAALERLVNSRDFYESIQLKPRRGDRIVLDKTIARLTQVLFVGLVKGEYTPEWVKDHFYFDVRSFIFYPRTVYFTEEALAHFGGKPYQAFEKRQPRLESFQGIGYKDFMEANAEIDGALVESLKVIIAARGAPLLITLAGPTAAGKTEITERLRGEFEGMGRKVTTIEVDNFLLDRDEREDKGMGKQATHFNIFKRSLEEIRQGRPIAIPRYDFLSATSSHALDGSLRPGCLPLEIEPADIIFIEGNFPFHTEEIARLIGVKVVYLTDDPIRLKRKWKRDIDYRKKYDPAYFINRFFKTQFLRAEDIYRPLIQICELVVDTTQANIWAAPEMVNILGK